MKKVKNDQGITLIALVITIVVLIILATVSINMILNEKGIIGAAEKAKDLYQKAESKEQSDLATLEGELQQHLPKTYQVLKAGTTVKIGDTEFFVIKDSGENEEIVAIMPKDSIENHNSSEDWEYDEKVYEADYEYDKSKAQEYGENLGGIGRLMTYDEAEECISNNSFVENLNYYGWAGMHEILFKIEDAKSDKGYSGVYVGYNETISEDEEGNIIYLYDVRDVAIHSNFHDIVTSVRSLL